MNCWEFMECGREEGGRNSIELGVCPTYPDHGRGCWRIVGTFCDGEVQGTYAKKIDSCRQCDFFNRVTIEEKEKEEN